MSIPVTEQANGRIRRLGQQQIVKVYEYPSDPGFVQLPPLAPPQTQETHSCTRNRAKHLTVFRCL